MDKEKKQEEAKQVEVPGEAKFIEERPKLADLENSGLSKQEIEAAKKHNLVSVEDKDQAKDGEGDASKKESKDTGKDTGEKIDADKKEEEPEGDADLEKIKNFNTNEKALYWNQKKERMKRQSAEAERDHALIKLKAKEEEMEEIRKKVSAPAPKPKDDLDDILGDGEETKEEISEDDKPLTRKDLAEMERKRQEEIKNQQEDKASRARIISGKLEEMEFDARQKYSDFETVANLADDLLKNGAKILAGDKARFVQAKLAAEKFLRLAATADTISDDDGVTAADMCYILGTLHPQYKASGTGNGDKSNEKDQTAERDGSLSPDKVDRIIKNANYRSSASVNGGSGKRLVSYDDLTVQDLAKLSETDFRKVPRNVRERLLRQ